MPLTQTTELVILRCPRSFVYSVTVQGLPPMEKQRRGGVDSKIPGSRCSYELAETAKYVASDNKDYVINRKDDPLLELGCLYGIKCSFKCFKHFSSLDLLSFTKRNLDAERTIRRFVSICRASNAL